MAISLAVEGDRASRTGSAPTLQTGWTMSVAFRKNGTGDRGGVGCVNGVGGADPYCFLAVDPGPTGVLLIDYNFGGGFNQTLGSTQLADNTDFHAYMRYDGSRVRVYREGTLEITSIIGVYPAGAAEVHFGWNTFDGTLQGRIANPKFATVDLGDGASTIQNARQYRNWQGVLLANIWESWHMKSGALGTGAINARNLTITGAVFVADPAFILGDDPAGGGGGARGAVVTVADPADFARAA